MGHRTRHCGRIYKRCYLLVVVVVVVVVIVIGGIVVVGVHVQVTGTCVFAKSDIARCYLYSSAFSSSSLLISVAFQLFFLPLSCFRHLFCFLGLVLF